MLRAIWDGPHSIEDIQIAQDELDALFTGHAGTSDVTIRSATGEAAGQNRACLAVHNVVGPIDEIAQALLGAKRLILLVGATSQTLMGHELKIILAEIRLRIDESCSISLGIRYLRHSEDDKLFVTVIFS